MPRKSFTDDIVYDFVCKNPGLCTYEISKRLKMTGGRVRHCLSKLEKDGLVKFEYLRNNPRIKKLTHPVDAWSLLPDSLKKELKKVDKTEIKKILKNI